MGSTPGTLKYDKRTFRGSCTSIGVQDILALSRIEVWQSHSASCFGTKEEIFNLLYLSKHFFDHNMWLRSADFQEHVLAVRDTTPQRASKSEQEHRDPIPWKVFALTSGRY